MPDNCMQVWKKAIIACGFLCLAFEGTCAHSFAALLRTESCKFPALSNFFCPCSEQLPFFLQAAAQSILQTIPKLWAVPDPFGVH